MDPGLIWRRHKFRSDARAHRDAGAGHELGHLAMGLSCSTVASGHLRRTVSARQDDSVWNEW